jgi:hypothetical protein
MRRTEQALAGLSKEQRTAAVAQITADMTDSEKAAYLDRLRTVRLAD